MNTGRLTALALAALLLLSITLPGMSFVRNALAQSGGGYDLSWWTVDGGGGAASGGGYALTGTAGQPDAGAALTGGGYTLTGGFWPGAAAAPSRYNLYLPLVVRNR